MAQIAGTNVIAPVVPGDTVDVFPSHLAEYGKGGMRTVSTLTARNNIPAERREELMLVGVTTEGKVYQLLGGISDSDWQEVSLSTSAPGYETYEAEENLSGHRIIAASGLGGIIYADNLVLSLASSVVGMTSGAIMEGETGPVRIHGPIENSSWSLIENGAIFLASNGHITQTPPVEGFSLVVGFAMTMTKVYINIGFPIFLGG